MKVMILAGGVGSRLAEETTIRPKPMVEIGGLPILWHIMSHYASFGYDEFVVALGYKGEEVKRYFADRCSLIGDLEIDLGAGNVVSRGGRRPDWNVELIETGAETQTGGRIKRLQPHSGERHLHVDVGRRRLRHRHRQAAGVPPQPRQAVHDDRGASGRRASVTSRWTATRSSSSPRSRRPVKAGSTARSSCASRQVFDYIDGDTTAWEREPLERLAKDGQLMAYRHESFWQCMDTLRDKQHLQALWDSGQAPWKVWS